MDRPSAQEFAPPFAAYIDRVPDGDVVTQLATQGLATRALLLGCSEAQGAHAYAPGKWTVKRLVQHLVDGERMFCYRAMCIARGETVSLPAFDEETYAANDGSDERTLAAITGEFASVRAATLTLFEGIVPSAARRIGIANGKPASPRALAWIIAGHELHHLAVLGERYGIG